MDLGRRIGGRKRFNGRTGKLIITYDIIKIEMKIPFGLRLYKNALLPLAWPKDQVCFLSAKIY
jgi:hypothetical protein